MVTTTADAEPSDPPSEEGVVPPRRWPAGIAEGVVYGAVVVLVCWPASLHPSAHIAGRIDAGYYIWQGWRIGRLLKTGHLPLRIPDAIWPFGIDLRLVDGYGPALLSGLWNLVARPYLAYNLTLATATVSNLWAARRLARTLTPSRVIWVLSAIAFATAPTIVERIQFGQPPLYFAFTLPLLLNEALEAGRRGKRVRLGRLAALLVLAFLCSASFLVFGGVMYAAVVLASTSPKRWLAAAWRMAVACAVVAVVLSPFIATRLARDRAESAHGGQPVLLSDTYILSSDGLAIFAQQRRSTFYLPGSSHLASSLLVVPAPDHVVEATVFPGLALLIALGALCWRESRWRWPLAAGAVATWVLTLGPSLKIQQHFVFTNHGRPVAWLPYRLLLTVPGLSSLRDPDRAAVALTAVAAAAFTLAMGDACRWVGRRGRIALVAGVSALLATNLLIPVPLDNLGTTAASAAALRAVAASSHAGDTVIKVPADCDRVQLDFAKLQIYHHLPVVGCTGAFAVVPWYSKLDPYVASRGITALRCDRSAYGRRLTPGSPPSDITDSDLALLRAQFGVRYLIVDKQDLAAPACASLRAHFATLTGLRSLGGDARWLVLDAGAPSA